MTTTLAKIVLDIGPDGRSFFREEEVLLEEYKPGLFLSNALPGGSVQLRVSPPGYWMDFHMSIAPQWTFVLSGALEIGLQDGTRRVFRAGDCLFSKDTLPSGATFDPRLHGHTARQVGSEPIVAALIR